MIPLSFIIGMLVMATITMESNDKLSDIAFTCLCEHYELNNTYCLTQQLEQDKIRQLFTK
jgi:hypothetical protein